MKRYTTANLLLTLLMAVASVSLSSCGEEPLDLPAQTDPAAPMEGYLTLQLNCIDGRSRADLPIEEGIESLHENLIQKVTLCLWPHGGDWPDTKEPVFMDTFDELNQEGEVILRIPLTETMISRLFNYDSSHSCNVFAAVNVDPGTAATPAQLRDMAISSTFEEKQEQESFIMFGSCSAEMQTYNGANFATGNIELQRSAAKIDLHLNVKPEVKETLADGSERTWKPDLEQIYVMLNNGVKASKVVSKPEEATADDYFNTPLDLSYRISLPEADGEEHGITNEKYPYVQEIPFYTYPNEWDSTDPDSPGRSFMTLRIPWSNDGGASYKTCYYRVPVVDPKLDEIVRNTSYHVLLDVSVLGSFVPDEPMPLEDLSYSIAEWGTEQIDVDIVQARYLVVDQNEFDVYNLNTISIPFYTSHETVVTDIKMTFYRFNYSDEGSKFPVTCTMAMNELSKTNEGAPVFTYDFDNNTDILTVNHDLVVYDAMTGTKDAPKEFSLTNNDGPNTTRARVVLKDAILKAIENKNTGIKWFKKKTPVEDEFSKVEFVVTVQHEDMVGTELFKETIKINQYPGMYIDAIQNNYTQSQNGTVISGYGTDAGAFVNGNNTAYNMPGYPLGGCANGYMTSIGLDSENNLNWNPNLYLITITRLPEGTSYILSDPRYQYINNDLSNESMGTENKTAWKSFTVGYSQAAPISAEAIYPGGTTRQIAYYYPTQEEESAANLIAPKFRICSSYAGTGPILNRVLARRRGAAYQEAGYPAGRWRLPTFAEVEFLAQLSKEYKIPRLFGTKTDEWKYWCANGKIVIPAKTSTTGQIKREYFSKNDSRNGDKDRTRFVYDEWYWGDETVNRNTFTWGDKPR